LIRGLWSLNSGCPLCRLQVIVQTRAALSKHVKGIAKQADEHEHFINKVWNSETCCSVLRVTSGRILLLSGNVSSHLVSAAS